MSRRRRIFLIVIIVPVAILINLLDLFSDPGNAPLSDLLIAQFITTASSSEISIFVFTVGDLYFLFYFNIVMGGTIYQYFRVGSVYYFARVMDRQGWYRRKLLALTGYAFLFSALLLTTYMGLCLPQSSEKIEIETAITFMLLLFFLTLIITISTAAINLLSIKYGSTKAFLIVYACELAAVYHILFSLRSQFLMEHHYIMALNPFRGLAGLGDLATDKIPIFCSGVYLLLILLMIGYTGGKYIMKVDIAIEDADKK
jgi:hypothetical protein